MYIISKARDYYDSAATYGIDKTVVYTRELKQIELPRWKYGQNTGHDFVEQVQDSGNKKIEEVLIGFCGKIYPCIKLETETDTAFAYSLEVLRSLADDLGFEVDEKAKMGEWARLRRYGRAINMGYAKHFFEYDHHLALKFFVEHHTPIFTISLHSGSQYLNVNDTLRNYYFQSMKDPATAFQDIYMFISGVLGAPPKPPEQPSDKLKAAIHGHDGEYSFKKPPGGKKWR